MLLLSASVMLELKALETVLLPGSLIDSFTVNTLSLRLPSLTLATELNNVVVPVAHDPVSVGECKHGIGLFDQPDSNICLLDW